MQAELRTYKLGNRRLRMWQLSLRQESLSAAMVANPIRLLYGGTENTSRCERRQVCMHDHAVMITLRC